MSSSHLCARLQSVIHKQATDEKQVIADLFGQPNPKPELVRNNPQAVPRRVDAKPEDKPAVVEDAPSRVERLKQHLRSNAYAYGAGGGAALGAGTGALVAGKNNRLLGAGIGAVGGAGAGTIAAHFLKQSQESMEIAQMNNAYRTGYLCGYLHKQAQVESLPWWRRLLNSEEVPKALGGGVEEVRMDPAPLPAKPEGQKFYSNVAKERGAPGSPWYVQAKRFYRPEGYDFTMKNMWADPNYRMGMAGLGVGGAAGAGIGAMIGGRRGALIGGALGAPLGAAAAHFASKQGWTPKLTEWFRNLGKK